jgi:hypothetical protein
MNQQSMSKGKQMTTRSLILMAGLLAAGMSQAVETSPGSATGGNATIAKNGNSWTLENDGMKAVVSFAKGSVDLTSLRNKTTGEELLTGDGEKRLFRHLVDEQEVRSDDGGWSLTGDTIQVIDVHRQNWGKELHLELSRPALKFSITLIFEIYDGVAGLRYYSFLKNDDATKKRVIKESDVMTLNFPNQPHTIFHVPWQTKWARTKEGLKDGKRQCLCRYDSGAGWALLPENNWCTSIKPGGYAGDPKNPYLFLNVWSGGRTNVTVTTNPIAVQLVLFPGERIEYFSVNIQVFNGDEWDARIAVAEHFRKRFKYHNPLPQLDFQEYGGYEFLQTDVNARDLLAPALAEAGFDRWEVTWRWNGCNADDRTEPRPGFTKDLPALADFFISKGLKIGYYFCMNGQMNGNGWGGGRDLADPKEIAYKQKQVEEILIGKYHSTWQMIDLGELWQNSKETGYSHPSDNVYRKSLNLRNYVTRMTRKYPEFTPLISCEVPNPGGAQCVSLMEVGENGQAGTYYRTDGGGNLRDAFNFIGLMPLESFVGVIGYEGDPWPKMFTPVYYYSTLLNGCFTFYSDVRNWTLEQRQHMRLFNDWRKNPRIGAVLRELARPLYNGPDNNNAGPHAWMYANSLKSSAILVALVFDKQSKSLPFDVKLRALDPGKTYLIEDITLGPKGFVYAYRGKSKGADLMAKGVHLDLNARQMSWPDWITSPPIPKFPGKIKHAAPSTGPSPCLAYWLQEQVSEQVQVLYADANVTRYEESLAGGQLTMKIKGKPDANARLVIAKPGKGGVENRDVKLDASGEATAVFDSETISEKSLAD